MHYIINHHKKHRQLKEISEVFSGKGLDVYQEQELDIEFADSNLTTIYTKFQQPPTESGINCSLAQLINEWHGLIEYAFEYLFALASTHYLQTRRKNLNSHLAEERFKNILFLLELAFCMPVSTAKVERLFSRLKKV